MPSFEPTRQAALARLAAVQPGEYARTRNALEGAVTRLSPYLTHGLLTLPEVFAAVHARHPLDARHKFVFELGWRTYYRHVWAHLGTGIHASLHPGLLPEDAYLREVPADVATASTGIAAIDRAVTELYETGYVHNHARMWLASYLVHLRKVHWHSGAEWMLGHLLDGDLASNHLSWQWVAGTGSSKPYLFNATNVAKFAPAEWHSPGTVIDTSYEALDALARSPHPALMPPLANPSPTCKPEPALYPAPPDSMGWAAPEPGPLGGKDVWLIHPWSLAGPPATVPQGIVVIGIAFTESHTATPWSARRWDFVTRGLQQHTRQRWWCNAADAARALSDARSVQWQSDQHVDGALRAMTAALAALPQPPRLHAHAPADLFAPVDGYCASFSRWWASTRLVLPSPH